MGQLLILAMKIKRADVNSDAYPTRSEVGPVTTAHRRDINLERMLDLTFGECTSHGYLHSMDISNADGNLQCPNLAQLFFNPIQFDCCTPYVV